jgi:O-antigen ligase
MTSDTGTPARATPGMCGNKLWGVFFFLVPVSSVFASQSVVTLLLIAAALLVVTIRRSLGVDRWPRPDRDLTVALGGLIILSAVASLWSFEPLRAFLLSARIAALLAAGLFLHAVLNRLDEAARTQAGNWLLAGIGLALVALYLEPALDFPILSLFQNLAFVSAVSENRLNRGAVAVAILCWPASAFLWRRAGPWVAMCLPAIVLGALAFLSSLSAGFGLIAAAATAIIATTHRRTGRIVLVAATLVAMAVSPLAGQKFYEAGLQDADWLPKSAAHRVEIWHFTVQRIMEKPVFGWGFDAARGMNRLTTDAEASGRNPIALHPHNAPLQILLELGIVGAMMALAIAWILIQRLETLPKRERILGQATYMAALAISCTAWGLWQNQWLALLVSAALAVSLTAPATQRSPAGKHI